MYITVERYLDIYGLSIRSNLEVTSLKSLAHTVKLISIKYISLHSLYTNITLLLTTPLRFYYTHVETTTIRVSFLVQGNHQVTFICNQHCIPIRSLAPEWSLIHTDWRNDVARHWLHKLPDGKQTNHRRFHMCRFFILRFL